MPVTFFETTPTVTTRRPCSSSSGFTDARRTFPGSAASRRLKRSVHEKTRWPIATFASCAAAETSATCAASMPVRVRAMSRLSPRVLSSAASAAATSARSFDVSAYNCRALKTVMAATATAAITSRTCTARSL